MLDSTYFIVSSTKQGGGVGDRNMELSFPGIINTFAESFPNLTGTLGEFCEVF